MGVPVRGVGLRFGSVRKTLDFRYRQWLVRKSYLFRIRRRPSDGRAKPECPVMAMSGSKRRNSAASAQGQEADIAVLAIDPNFQVYGNPWFSVQLTLGE